MAVCMDSTACKAGTSWSLRHLCQYPLVTVVAATVDNSRLQLGTLPQSGHSCWRIRGGHHDFDFVIEQRGSQWIMNIGTWHTQMQGCPTCLLCKVGHLAECRWHRVMALSIFPLRVVHMICEKDDNTSVVHFRGVLDHLPQGGNFWIFHLCTLQQILQLGKSFFLPNLLPNSLFLPSRRAHWLGSKVMPLLPHFDKLLFHLSISGTSSLRLVVKPPLWMSGSQGAIVKTRIGDTAVLLLPSVLSGSCLYMSSVMHFMCDLVSDVLSTYIVYEISACYRISFTLIEVGWIFTSVRLPPSLKRKKTISRCVCIQPAWLTDGMVQTELSTLLDPLSLIFVSTTMALSPRGCGLCSHGILIAGKLSTQMTTSSADAKDSLEKVLFAFRKQSGLVLKLRIFINRFRVFVSVILLRCVVASVPGLVESQFYCHLDGKCLKSWNLCWVEQLRSRYRIAPANSC